MESESTSSRATAEKRPGRELYAILHVSPTASADDIRKAYLNWSVVIHPDKIHDPELKDAAMEIFCRISEAYDILSDADKRNAYDFYGMEGPNSGLEFETHVTKVEEANEELEKSKCHKEYEEAPSQASTSFKVFTNLYRDGDGIIGRMLIGDDFKLYMTDSNTISVGGKLTVSGNKGNGSAKVEWMHQACPDTQVGLYATAGVPSLIAWRASRQFSHYSSATLGLTYSLRNKSVNVSNTWARKLSETRSADIQFVLGKESTITVGWNNNKEKTSAYGEVKFTASNFGASACYTYDFSQQYSFQVAANMGSFYNLEISCGRRICDSSSVLMIYKIGAEGITSRFELDLKDIGKEKLVIPIFFSQDLNSRVATGALMISSSLYFLIENFVLKPYYLRRERRKALEKKEPLNQIKKARDAAKRTQRMLQNVSNRKKNKEIEVGGLVITKAIYGNLRATGGIDGHLEVNDDPASPVLDVTLPLYFLVKNSQLELPEETKMSSLMGFCDPCPGKPKQLLVEYTFHGQNYKVVVDDYDLFRIPQDTHKI